LHLDTLTPALTIMTIPGAGHFVRHDAAQTVSDTMIDWLQRRSR